MDSSAINDSWREFMCTLSEKDSDNILEELPYPILELMDKQAHVDQMKKHHFKPAQGHILKLYLGRIDIYDLELKIKSHDHIFKRALGVDKLNHLKLLVRLKIMIEDKKPKRGLLAV